MHELSIQERKQHWVFVPLIVNKCICIVNTLFLSQDVIVEKFPFKKGFSAELTQFMVEAGEDMLLNLMESTNLSIVVMNTT